MGTHDVLLYAAWNLIVVAIPVIGMNFMPGGSFAMGSEIYSAEESPSPIVHIRHARRKRQSGLYPARRGRAAK